MALPEEPSWACAGACSARPAPPKAAPAAALHTSPSPCRKASLHLTRLPVTEGVALVQRDPQLLCKMVLRIARSPDPAPAWLEKASTTKVGCSSQISSPSSPQGSAQGPRFAGGRGGREAGWIALLAAHGLCAATDLQVAAPRERPRSPRPYTTLPNRDSATLGSLQQRTARSAPKLLRSAVTLNNTRTARTHSQAGKSSALAHPVHEHFLDCGHLWPPTCNGDSRFQTAAER